MSACPYYVHEEHGADNFTVAMPRLTFGRGSLSELGARTAHRGYRRVVLITDPMLVEGEIVAKALDSLRAAGVETRVFSDIRIEPDEHSVAAAVAALAEHDFDAVVSVGGGSAIDTAKAALAVLANGGVVGDYFAPPAGSGKAIDIPLKPHIACPTTSGTGSECTTVSVIRINELDCKFVFASPYMLPEIALVDPACCDSLPAKAIASTGFDLLCHALESYTARAYTRWQRIDDPSRRQLLQGANPFSEIVAREALSIVGRHLERGVNDPDASDARDQLMWGATLAGIAFGNSGTHLPHAMSYGVTHLMHDITTDGYKVASPFVPHGISVIVNAPSIFGFTAAATPERHLEGAVCLQADDRGATPDDTGEVLARRLIELMRGTGMPNGLEGLGFDESYVAPMAASAIRQGRAIANAPREANQVDMENLYRSALRYW